MVSGILCIEAIYIEANNKKYNGELDNTGVKIDRNNDQPTRWMQKQKTFNLNTDN